MDGLEAALVASQVPTASFGFARWNISAPETTAETIVAAETTTEAATVVVVAAATARSRAATAVAATTATATAVAATTATATATATATTTIAAAGSACARRGSARSRSATPFVGFVYPEIAAAELEAVKFGDRLASGGSICVFYKCESSRSSSLAILGKKAVYDLPDFRENCFQLLFGSVEVEVPHKQFGADDVLLQTGRPRLALVLPLLMSLPGQCILACEIDPVGPR